MVLFIIVVIVLLIIFTGNKRFVQNHVDLLEAADEAVEGMKVAKAAINKHLADIKSGKVQEEVEQAQKELDEAMAKLEKKQSERGRRF